MRITDVLITSTPYKKMCHEYIYYLIHVISLKMLSNETGYMYFFENVHTSCMNVMYSN